MFLKIKFTLFHNEFTFTMIDGLPVIQQFLLTLCPVSDNSCSTSDSGKEWQRSCWKNWDSV